MQAPPPRHEFQIGWICALPIEAAAAKEMLDANFGLLDEQDSADTNSYTLGQIGKHFVVIASLGQGQYGTTSATTVAVNMMRTFSESLRIGLMVGVGAGLPSASHDIRLGDIVVSSPEGSCGGVLQYDRGKVVNGKLQRTGALNSPPRPLLNAVALLRAAALTDDPAYTAFIDKAISRNNRTRQTFGRPDPSTDRLFLMDKEHCTESDTREICPTEWEVKRKVRPNSDSQVHYGIIASGNAVQKHGSTREQLRQETDAICFEMEAAGLMMDFPCIVVRGICDYADSHKNKQWQGYAAVAAAAYTKEMLSYVPKGQVSRESFATEICSRGQQIVDEIKGVSRSLDKAVVQREAHHRERIAKALTREQQDCHRAFKTSPYEQYKNINPDRAQGTCQWIFEHPHYKGWLESHHDDLLWVSADPGCGKSVLSKSLVERDLPISTPASICYFFFKDNNEQNSLATALCAVMHQLFGFQPELLRHAMSSWQKTGPNIQQEIEELWRILEAASSDETFSNTICIFDALDECRPDDQRQLIQKLQAFYTKSHAPAKRGWLKFLATSRPYQEIQENFQLVTESFPRIRIRGEDEDDRIHEEISLVVKIRVAELGRDLQLSPATVSQLEECLLQMKHRTYLWLYLALEDIRITLRNSLEPEEETFRLIPDSVRAAYEKILQRVPVDNISDVISILQIIVGARRPLDIKEMAMALGVARQVTGPASPARPRTASKAGLPANGLGEKIRHLCGLFVTVHNAKFYLIHQTAREFLQDRTIRISGREISMQRMDIEALMGKICVHYLTLDGITSSEDDSRARSLLTYAALHWADHIRLVPLDVESGLAHQLDQLYDVSRELHGLWFPVFWSRVGNWYQPGIENDPTLTPITLAALNGHGNIISKLSAAEPSAIMQLDPSGRTPLYWAALFNRLDIVNILIARGAKVDAQPGEYFSPLQAASASGCLDIVRVLIEKGANVNARDPSGNALQVAVFRGNLDIIRLLVQNGADVNAQGDLEGSALQIASKKGDLDAVHFLIESGANINAQGGLFGNALQTASAMGNLEIGHLEVVRLLIQKGANVNAQGGMHGNALKAAASSKAFDTVRLLIEKGAIINDQGRLGSSALKEATSSATFSRDNTNSRDHTNPKGWHSIVQFLIQNGATYGTKE